MDDSAQLVKDRLSIVDVVGQYVPLKKSGRNWTGRCPFHKERTPSFMVSPERGTYMCFGCGEKGDIFSFIEKMDGLDFRSALAQLAERAGVELPKYHTPSPERKEESERLREACRKATEFFEQEFSKHAAVERYVSSRGVSEDVRKKWRLGYAPAAWDELSKHLLAHSIAEKDIVAAGLAVESKQRQGSLFDRFRGRVMFPIFDVAGNPIAFSGRFFEDVPGARREGEPAKYVNSPETLLFRKSKVLYGLHAARDYIRRADCALLVEGQFDLLLSHQSGLPFAVAASGTALTAEHLALLGRYTKRLVLALDGDEAGIKAGLRASLLALGAGFDVKIPNLGTGKDPAELAAKDPELLKSAVRSAKPAIDFFLEAFAAAAKSERAYQKLVEMQIVPLIAVMPSSIDRAHFTSAVARRLRLPEGAVAEAVAKRPRLLDEALDRQAEPPLAPPVATPLERQAAMLLFFFGDKSAVGEKLKVLLGAGRFNEVEVKLKSDAERLQFEFEALAEEKEEGAERLAGDLLARIERMLLQEEIRRTRARIADVEQTLDSALAGELAHTLEALIKRKEALKQE